MHESHGTALRGDSGAAAVEFALVLPVLMAIVLGILGFGRAFHTQIDFSNAAQEGARYLVFTGGATSGTAKNIVVAASSVSPALTTAEVSVSGSCATAGSDVTVTAARVVTFDYVLGTWNRTVTGKARMKCPG